MESFDFVIIGAGPAGEAAAHKRKLRNLKRGQRFIGAPARYAGRLPTFRSREAARSRAGVTSTKTPLRALWDYAALHKRQASEAAP